MPPPPIPPGLATSVAAFVGTSRRGPIDQAVRLRSFGDFQRRFGGLSPDSEMTYAVRHFFQGGGRDAWAVRVARDARPARRTLTDAAGRDVLEVTAAAVPGVGPPEGRLLYLDADDHRLIAEDAGDARMRASGGAVRRIYRDYRTVAGVLWPFYEVRMRGGTKAMTLSVQSLTVNTGVSDRMFEPPTQGAKNQPLR